MDLNVKEYQRLFRHKGIYILSNEAYIRAFKDYDYLIILKGTENVVYMGNDDLSRTHAEGGKRFQNAESIREYYRESTEFMRNFDRSLSLLAEKNNYSKQDIGDLFDLFTILFGYYKFTDFHFSEAYFELMQDFSKGERQERVKERSN